MKSPTKIETNKVARRRRRLILDYKYYTTHTALRAHGKPARRMERVVNHCFGQIRRQFLPHYFLSAPRWRLLIRQFANERALPDFCIIGPPKSGTSDIAITIMSHPNVLPPLVKEFLSKSPKVWSQYYPTRKAVQRHAQRHGVALCALVSPSLHFLDTIGILADLCPTTKIVINLRNPADLVFSQWKWIVLHRDKDAYVDKLPFLATFPAFVDKALELFPEIPFPFSPGLHSGIYATSVAHWLRAFGQNVRIFDVAEYFNDPSTYFERLQRFLGLPVVMLPPRLPVANRNPLEFLAPNPKASEKLMEFFEPYNRRLWEVIGATYPWSLPSHASCLVRTLVA